MSATPHDVDEVIEYYINRRNDFGERQIEFRGSYYEFGVMSFVNALNYIFSLQDEGKTPDEIISALIDYVKNEAVESGRVLSAMKPFDTNSPDVNKARGIAALIIETKRATYGTVPYSTTEELNQTYWNLRNLG